MGSHLQNWLHSNINQILETTHWSKIFMFMKRWDIFNFWTIKHNSHKVLKSNCLVDYSQDIYFGTCNQHVWLATSTNPYVLPFNTIVIMNDYSIGMSYNWLQTTIEKYLKLIILINFDENFFKPWYVARAFTSCLSFSWYYFALHLDHWYVDCRYMFNFQICKQLKFPQVGKRKQGTSKSLLKIQMEWSFN